jgi:hypothetical protein
MIVIDKDVPLTKQTARKSKYPFAIMVVGDSFVAPLKPASLRSVANSFAKTQGDTVKFAVRAEGEGARIWRVA